MSAHYVTMVTRLEDQAGGGGGGGGIRPGEGGEPSLLCVVGRPCF